MKEAKDMIYKFRLDAADRERLDELAALYEMSASAVVRMLITARHMEVSRSTKARRQQAKVEQAVAAALAALTAKPTKRAAKKGGR